MGCKSAMALDSVTDMYAKAVCGPELPAGTSLLDGANRITGMLNSGGFGIIYSARDSRGQTVVLKECFPATLCRRDGTSVCPQSADKHDRFAAVLAAFVTEARVLTGLAYPGIVRAHRLFHANGTAYLAMDHLPGRDILDILDQRARSFAPAEIVTLARKLIATVGHLHSKGLVHCDIALDNIILTQRDGPVLIDFGAVRPAVAQPDQAFCGPRVVKDGYSPPEQYMPGAPLGPASDLYALAASLYHLISGVLPANGDARLAARDQNQADPCAPLAGTIAGYPAGFLASIDRAMAVHPDDRIASAGAWLSLVQPRPEKPVLLLRRSVADAHLPKSVGGNGLQLTLGAVGAVAARAAGGLLDQPALG